MFWNKKNDKLEEEIFQQMANLWEAHNNLSMLVKSITDIMRHMAEGVKANKDDFEHLAQQTLRIADTQNKILAHLSGNEAEDYLTRDFTKTVH